MSQDEYKAPRYPVVEFLVTRGTVTSIILALVPFFAGIYLTLIGWGVVFAFIGFITGAVIGGLLMSYIEVLQIIADTLIPK